MCTEARQGLARWLVGVLCLPCLLVVGCSMLPPDEPDLVDEVDEPTPLPDEDEDGSPSSEDCDDSDPLNAPHLSEHCDGQDNDCDGEVDEGFDADEDGVSRCGADLEFGTADDDCDDEDPGNYPGNAELCDAEDNDCDEEIDEVFDGDGDGTTSCGADGVAGTEDDDCDDSDPDVEPGIWDDCDGLDVNCNGLVDEDCDDTGGTLYCYADADGDGYGGAGTVVTADTDCLDAGESGVTGDCDDSDSSVHPGAIETPQNGVDEDCDGADQQSDCTGPAVYASEGEPNDSESATNLILAGGGHLVLEGSITCGAGGDDDWFSLSFTCGGPVSFELDWPGGSSDLDFSIAGAASAGAFGNSTSGPATDTASAAPGSMLLHIDCPSGSPSAYTFTVDWD